LGHSAPDIGELVAVLVLAPNDTGKLASNPVKMSINDEEKELVVH
jgi:hypothetical protein